MTGSGGEVRAGYQVAARLGRWEFYLRGDLARLSPDGPWGVAAEIVSADDFWLDELAAGARGELILDVAGARQLRWSGVTVIPGRKLVIHGIGKPSASAVTVEA